VKTRKKTSAATGWS